MSQETEVAAVEALMREPIARLVERMLEYPLVDDSTDWCKTDHYFADGEYLRRRTYKKGFLSVGKIHRQEHFTVIAKGRLLFTDGVTSKIAEAGDVFVTPVGSQKAIYALEDSVMLTVHATELTDPEEIERQVTEDPLGLMLGNRLTAKGLEHNKELPPCVSASLP